jgi:hypothetical protein
MRSKRWWRAAASALWLWGSSGCTSLKEVPRSEYASRPERKQVRVLTNDNLHYEFDYAEVRNDTLIGYRRRDVEGPIDEFDALPIPLENVAKLSARHIDWYRTGLIGGVSLAAVIAAGLSARGGHGGGSSGGGGPCPREPCESAH